MCYEIDKTERFLDCAFGFARNDKVRDWNGNVCCVHKDMANTKTLIFMRESLNPYHPRNPWLMP